MTDMDKMNAGLILIFLVVLVIALAFTPTVGDIISRARHEEDKEASDDAK
jgi:NADH:ubiquinone oxidoreductase subunit 3 (subunit A)